jgi:acetyltransferase-like isoleucine patch superfamily enzyme
MSNNFSYYYRKLQFPDFIRKVIFALLRVFSFRLLRTLKAIYYFKNSKILLGKRVSVHGISYQIEVGDKTAFYDNCIFEFGHESEVKIGADVILSYGVLLSCNKKITIGNDVQVGEYTSIRDTTHDYKDLERPMKHAPDIPEEVIIANNVWIGRGCIILPGTVIEEGVVVAANSVVKGKLERNGIYGGTPARFIKLRDKK